MPFYGKMNAWAIIDDPWPLRDPNGAKRPLGRNRGGLSRREARLRRQVRRMPVAQALRRPAWGPFFFAGQPVGVITSIQYGGAPELRRIFPNLIPAEPWGMHSSPTYSTSMLVPPR